MSIAASLPLRSTERDPFLIFLAVSLLIHLLILLLWPQLKRIQPPPEQLTEVELLPPEAVAPPLATPSKRPSEPQKKEEPQPVPEVPDQQIVSVPDEVNDQIPDQTRFLSDRNTAVEEERVAVGTPAVTPPEKREPTRERVAPEKPQPEPATQLALSKPAERIPARRPKPQLFARQDDLLAKGWLSSDGDAEDEEAERSPPTGNELLALAPPPARENYLTLPGPRGTLDYLPDVRRGALTFLNTKASRFAPFVRRVAQRVFQHLLIRQRRNLQVDDVVAARHPVQIQAKLDENGALRGITLHTRSGSYAVDESLLDACQQGAWDENPPPEAKADDGNYHFIFRSHINARFDATGLRSILTYLEVGLV